MNLDKVVDLPPGSWSRYLYPQRLNCPKKRTISGSRSIIREAVLVNFQSPFQSWDSLRSNGERSCRPSPCLSLLNNPQSGLDTLHDSRSSLHVTQWVTKAKPFSSLLRSLSLSLSLTHTHTHNDWFSDYWACPFRLNYKNLLGILKQIMLSLLC